MNLVTCNGTAKVWRSASKNLSYITIFTCRILETLHSIVPAITLKKLSKQFLVYEADWNVLKMNRGGKCDRKYCLFFSQLLIFRIYTVGSKLLYLGKVLLWEMIFYIVCTDDSVIDRQKFCRYGWGNLFRKSSVDGG
ncbi:hypothetical protein RhiirC2_188877 [Rhizophagus irregularis]|uniref:Uncharacterized protein n=1 Tax=Rhizophagus irregularis TaxID=588596 RepID=A0A2N1NQK5_9GLOM|nr:hypothetical protein RhiirC2_188877 [Rhizophagus irregularis]